MKTQETTEVEEVPVVPDIPWWSMSIPEVETKLATSTNNGLSTAEVQKRLEEYGHNELQAEEKRPRWKVFLDQFKDVLIYILMLSAVASGVLNYVEKGHLGEDWIVIAVIVILNAVIGYIQEGKADSAIEALMNFAAPDAQVIRDGKEISIKARELVPGDVILIHEGDMLPADGRIFELSNMKLEEAALTGESVPLYKHIDVIGAETPLAERKNCVYASTLCTYGRGKAMVTQTGMTTEVGKIAEMISGAEAKLTPLQKNLEQFGALLGKIILIICALVSGIYILQNYLGVVDVTWIQAVMAGVALAVAAIPEGLPAVVTTCLAIGVTRMSERNAIVKKLHSVETLGCTSVICSDKTGTLTKNEMTVRSIWTGGKVYNVSGSGYEPEGDFVLNEAKIDPLSVADLELTLRVGLVCNDARLSQDESNQKWSTFGDPTEGCLVTSAWKAGLEPKVTRNKFERLDEIPFDSKRKRMTTINMVDGKKVAYIKGATEILLDFCDNIIMDGIVRPITAADKKNILAAYEQKASEALRGLGFAHRENIDGVALTVEDMEQHMTFVGMQFMIDPPRDEVKQAIVECKKAGIGVKMITGDNLITATAIAVELGIIKLGDQTYEGKNIANLTEEDIQACNVFARVSPEHKMDIVNALQNKGEVAAMTGDGVNDAPALKNAHVGVAMGITGTDVSKEAAVMVLADDNFATIVHAVEEGRGIYDNIKKFVQYLLSSNIMEVLVLLFAAIIGIPPPLVATQLLWINLVTDGAPALALGFDPYDPTLMQQKPRPLNEPLLTKNFIITMVYRGVILTVLILGIFVIYDVVPFFEPQVVPDSHVDLVRSFEGYLSLDDWRASVATANDLESLPFTDALFQEVLLAAYVKWYARSVTFLTMMFAEMANAYNCRSEYQSIFKIGFFTNKFMSWAAGASVLLTFLLYFWRPLGNIFKVIPLRAIDWIWLIPTLVVTVGCVELLKIYFRKQMGLTK
ncbi:MAG: cation-translocating P-type ATPase [Promethearchaeota archaeon]